MLPRQQRLHTDRDIRTVLRFGQRTASPFLTVRSIPNKAKQHRFAFVVSRSVSKLAVKRNTLKRRLRTVAKHLHPPTPTRDWLIITHPSARDLPQTTLEQELQRLINQPEYEKNRRRPH